MAEVFPERYKASRLHHANVLNHNTAKPSSQLKHGKVRASSDTGYKPGGRKSGGKLVANHDLVETGKTKGKSKDLEMMYDFIHGENLFPLQTESGRSSFSKGKSLSERKERDFIHLEAQAETEIKIKIPVIREPKLRVQNQGRVPPLKDVKRRLDFGENEQILTTDKETNGLDFTDKLAALRSLIGTGLKNSQHIIGKDGDSRVTSSPSNQLIHPVNKHLSQKAAHLTRSDSLKENGNIIEMSSKRKKKRDEAEITRSNEKADNVSEGKSDAKITEDRLSALTVDLHALKDRLYEKRRTKNTECNNNNETDRYLDKFITKSQRAAENRNGIAELVPDFEVGDALDHISPDRKIIESTKKFKSESRLLDRDTPSSKLGHKEIQTDVLNQSIRSIQSNVPFYEPYSSGFGEVVKRPVTTASSSVRKQFVSNENINKRNGGISEGVNLGKSTESSSHTNEKQTNVNSFVGTSLTPEKDKQKSVTKVLGKYQERLAVENQNENCILKERPIERKINSEQLRSEKEKKIKAYQHLKGNLRAKDKDDSYVYSEKRKVSSYAAVDKFDTEENFFDKDFTKRIIENTNKTERKVREWIKSQEKHEHFLPRDSGPLTLDELSVSPSAESKEKLLHPASSPNDSCDRIPVKLEKWENETEQTNNDTKKVDRLTRHLRGTNSVLNRESHTNGSQKSGALGSGFPVKDTAPMKGSLQHHQSFESLDDDSQSSIFSLPFSIKSGESVSSTLQAVKLLRKLYNVDVEKRQALVLKARCFRRWLNNVLHMKAQNYRIQEAARVSPISYGVLLRKGEICYRSYILEQFFNRWKAALAHVKLQKAVKALQRKHMLQKGMNAFKWAINRSKLRQGILQDRISGILLAASFVKWKTRAEENRRCRLQMAFARWRQFTKEAQNMDMTRATPIQRMCMLRNQTNQKLKQRVFLIWCQKFEMRQKQHKADAHFRTVLVSHGWASWRQFTVINKEKKLRVKLATVQYESKLQRRTFTLMKIELEKYRRAKHSHRTTQLKQALRAWKAGSNISKGERENDFRVAVVYWSRSTLRSHFVAWRDELLNKRACRMSDRLITKHTFSTWTYRYQQLIRQREAVDSYVRQKIMFQALKQWCYSVAVQKRRREIATECIENVLQRYALNMWHAYTVYQKDLRKRLQLNIRKKHLQMEKKYLAIWKSHFKIKLDEQRAFQLWSNSCARKAADKWLLMCHKRSLDRLLVDTEPLRQLNTQKVAFMKWKAALGQIEAEKREAADVRAILDHSQLRQCYDKWKAATQQLLTIKPMVSRYRKKLVALCLENWLSLVQHKRQCKSSKEQFQKELLRKKFTAWRRHYFAHQKEKELNKKLVTDQARRCLQGWRFVIQRKHLARQFHDKHLVRSSFYFWNTLTVRQLRQKHMEKLEYETEMSIKREYFDRWRQKLYSQQTHAEEVVTLIQQQQANNSVRQMFNFWRRHFRATLVARENEKIRVRRLARQALQEWHTVTHSSLEEAVERFAVAIGLQQGTGDANYSTEGDGQENANMLEDTDELDKLTFEPMNPVLAMTQSPPRRSRTPRTPRTPRHASSCATPLRRLFSPTLSHQSLAQSMEFESANMLSSSFLDAKFEMEHAVKTESRREIVVTVVSRLRHWPLSIMFDQWKEFTARQQEFKSLTTQMISIQEKLVTKQCFNTWVKTFHEMKLAKQHYDQVLQHKAILSLVLYRNSRKEKKHLTAVAKAHYTLRVYNKVFPMWSVKAQEKHQRERIINLWTNITPEEQELIPRERSFKYQLNRKSLLQVFGKWKSLYCKITKLKKVYHKILLQRTFGPWCTWALERHDRHMKSEEFRRRRITMLVFKTWCIRYTQKTEVARRYDETWHNYLGLILISWSRWAKDQRRNCRLAVNVTQRQNTMLVFGMFNKWKQETRKQIRVKRWYETRLTVRALLSWQSVAAWQKETRDKLLNFRLRSYTKLAKQTFSHWHQYYIQKQLEHKEHKRRLQQKTLEIARVWRCKAQETRGAILEAEIENRHLQSFFNKWKSAHNRNLEREDQLQTYLGNKNCLLLQECLDTWKSALMGLQAERMFNMKLLAAFVSEWTLAAKACKQRRENLIGYQKSQELHTQKGYFLYWFNVARARKSIRGHANLKIQLTAFKAWLVYTRRSINLRRLEKSFTRRKNQKTLQNHWYMMKTRFHYCQELTNMADKVIRDKNETLMRQALGHWEFRLQVVIASECYHHLLAKRVARTWRRFVTHKREERQRELEQMEKARRFCEKKLCNMVFGAWYNEVLVSKQILRHKSRIQVKYGCIWKHKVDLMFTAKCVRTEHQLSQAWNKWHMAYTKRKAMKKVEAFERKQSLTMVFVSWRNLCKKRRMRGSMIPLPVSPAFSMPSAGTSSSSTPTEEVLSSPTFGFSGKPSQIPAPSSRRSKLPSYSGKTSTNNSHDAGSSTSRRASAL